MDTSALADFLRRAKSATRPMLTLAAPSGEVLLEDATIGEESAAEIEELVTAYAADLSGDTVHRFALKARSAKGMGASTHTIRVRGGSSEPGARVEVERGREMQASFTALTKCVTDVVRQLTTFSQTMLEVEAARRSELDAAERRAREAGNEVEMTRIILAYEQKKSDRMWDGLSKLVDRAADKIPLLLANGAKTETAKPDDLGSVEELTALRARVSEDQWKKILSRFGVDVTKALQELSTPRELARFMNDWAQEDVMALVAILGQDIAALLGKLLAPQLRAVKLEKKDT